MSSESSENAVKADVGPRRVWWRSIGPGLITACVVFGPGSLLVSSKVGATHGYELLWLLALTGIMMGVYISMGARIGVVGQATPCQLIATHGGRTLAVVIGINLCLICAAFQFANNLAVAAAADSLGIAGLFGNPEEMTDRTKDLINSGVLVVFNGLIITFVFTLKHVYRALERIMKVMVAIIIISFALNLYWAKPDLVGVFAGLIPSWPEDISLAFPKITDGGIYDPMILLASLLGTTFSVGGAFFQGNLVREKGWKIEDYNRGIGDSIAGVCVLACVSGLIMITSGTLLLGQPAHNIGMLATQLKPLLGVVAHALFCVGLLAVAMNPFVINAMIGGSILADGLGKPPRFSDTWPRRFTVLMMLIGMGVALLIIHTPIKFIDAIIFGQALTVLGNPLMALAMLWLANRKDVMGERRNGPILNVLAVAGLCLVLFMATRVLWLIALKLT